MWVAKPNLNNKNGIKEFPTAKEAVAYLEEYTGSKWLMIEIVRPKRLPMTGK